jgi:large subunit ribosomal protein L18
MATKKMRVVPYRRKREGKTNYKKRLKLLLSSKLRLVIRKSLKNMQLQLVEYNENGDKVLLTISSKALDKEFEWKISRSNLPASYLTGLLFGLKAKKKGYKEAILDIGLQTSVKGSRIYAAVRGVIDGGLPIACSNEMLPDDATIQGKKIMAYAADLKKKDEKKYQRQFSFYIKQNIDPAQISSLIEATKKKILSK